MLTTPNLIDFDLGFLKEATELVDNRIDYLAGLGYDSSDADAFGIYDSWEYVVGFGFVACQTYLTAVRGRFGLDRSVLTHGPNHTSGVSFANLVNGCANFWKHSSEWNLASLKPLEIRTKELVEALGAEIDESYPLGNCLQNLVAPKGARFANVVPMLIEWRDAVR